jgi:NADH-quinone oxidoreductase subunit L
MFCLIPLFPLLGVLVNGTLGVRYFSRRTIHTLAISMMGLSFLFSVLGFIEILRSESPYLVRTLYTWVPANPVELSGGGTSAVVLEFAFRYDSLAAVMALVVTGVGLLIHIYAIGYMAQDKSYARFFAYMNLFTFAMLLLILGANLAVMFIGWEGVGLCSYLLIGFWFNKDTAARAGKKAFITNRVGDFGFLLGIGLLIYHLGTVDFAHISALVGSGILSKEIATAAALLLFLGATGKSAQIPLYTWLPDAMEGPTPVSALIHAATMVTAGVYLVARLHVLFAFSGTALTVVAVVGAVTAVYAASLAVVQDDIKRVLAYSTISQIGYMFIGLGVGAYAAGIFHLMTHAFFKSLLFLAAGSVIHALSGEQDLRKMGGLRSHIPKTYRVFLIGALAIAGVPGLSGFFSKDEILAAAFASGHYLVWGLGLIGTVMTAFYMFRLIFLAFFGKGRREHDAAPPHSLHEAPAIMIIPLQILAVLAVIGGFAGLPQVLGGGNWLGKFLESSTGSHHPDLAAGTEIVLMILAAGLGLLGIYAAYVVYVKKNGVPAERFVQRFKTLYKLLYHKYFVDEFYNGVIVAGVMKLGTALARYDLGIIDAIVNGIAALTRKISSLSISFDAHIIDGAVNGIGTAYRFFSTGLRKLQDGCVYNYALAIVMGIVIIISFVVIIF